jgi:hypothetical protein
MKRLLILLAACALTASAADISGNWKGTAETAEGTIERSFVFKVDGNNLTGETTSNNFGKSIIDDGKVDGDNVSFTLKISMGGKDAKVSYKGKVTDANTIKFTVGVEGFGQTIDFVAKRTS